MGEWKKPTGRVSFVRVLAGGYLVYLAYRMVRSVLDGSTEYRAVSLAGAAAFGAVGAALLIVEGRRYRYGAAHRDDPSSWNDEAGEDGGEEDGA